jgi:hypothetical protein
MVFRVNVYFQDFNREQTEKMKKAVKAFETIMNLPEFKEKMQNFKSPLGNKFAENQGLTNQQIVYRLFSGSEQATPSIDYEADLNLQLVERKWWHFNKKQGYIKDSMIFTYLDWYDNASALQYAEYIAHQWACLVGFSDKATKDLKAYTVPEAFGEIILEIGKALAEFS